MIDPKAEVHALALATVRVHAGLLTSLGGRAKVYDYGVPNLTPPYVFVSAPQVVPADGDGFSGSDLEIAGDAWSLTDPPGQAEAAAILAQLEDALLSLQDLTTASFRITEAHRVRSQVLPDITDGKTAHGIVTVGLLVEPL